MESQEDNFKKLIIGNEQEAFAALEQALKNELGDQPLLIEFKNWPLIEICLEGPGYESTITPDMAAGLVELQGAMNRAYAKMVHQSSSARKLTDAERKDLQFKAKVENGCSLITVDLGDFAGKIGSEMVSKLDPMHLVISVVGVAIAGASLLAYKAFLKHRTADKTISEEVNKAIALSQEETRRLAIFGQAVSAVPRLQAIQEDFDEARHEIVRGTSDAASLTVNSVKMDNESAKIVAMTKRTQSREVQLNGDYFIQETHWQNEKEIRLKLRSVTTAQEFMATMQNDTLNDEQIEFLQGAEWSRAKVYMSINATELRGTVTTATILSVTIQPTEDSSSQI